MDEPMDRPYVVCHMLTSLDGKIDGGFFSLPDCLPALRAYGRLRDTFQCQATLYGTTTMLGGYAKGRIGPLPEAAAPVTREDFSASHAAAPFLVSLDPEGILAFDGPVSTRKGRAPAHIVEVLTDKTSDAYLAYLQGLGISYLFAGKESIDCVLLLRKCKALFGIDRVLLAGGGVTNQAFAAAGLIDELSIVLAPTTDGDSGSASLFETGGFSPATPAAYSLQAVERIENDTLWLRYLSKNRRAKP